MDVLAKPLADGGIAVCFFNKSKIAQKRRLDVAKLYKDPYVSPAAGRSATSAGAAGAAMSIIAGDAAFEQGRIVARIPADGVVVVKTEIAGAPPLDPARGNYAPRPHTFI